MSLGGCFVGCAGVNGGISHGFSLVVQGIASLDFPWSRAVDRDDWVA